MTEVGPVPAAIRLGDAGLDWLRQRSDCTPAATASPRLQERHLAVLVGGLGSSSTDAAVDALDTAALGYADGDVSRFSYRGASTDVMPYQPSDTTVDMRQSARLLREYLQHLEQEHPGVPIDVIGHSQGGVVAREALTNEFDGLDPTLPQVSSLVTLGSPHQGTDVATAAAMVGVTQVGRARDMGRGQAHALGSPGSVGATAVGDVVVHPRPQRPSPPRRPLRHVDRCPRRPDGARRPHRVRRAPST